MPGRLQTEIRQTRPFPHPAEEAFLNLQRTAGWLMGGVEETLRSFGLTHPQYNVLRILAGAGPGGLPCGEVAARMITRDPDITRLLDRMEKRGHVRRGRTPEDRRIVRACLTPEGAATLRSLEKPVRDAIRSPLAPLGAVKLAQLTALLEEIRIQMEGEASI
ncbi:MAG: MarR family transcriptional regulator [Acidobacteria bacterium]|nr:MarR family transcriptional regulator [Acidobacteriota bacterium]